jgi:hypothetical protein
MKLSIGVESEREGAFESAEEISFVLHTIEKENTAVETYDQYEILNETVTLKNTEELQIDCFYIPSTSGFGLEIYQHGKVIFQLTSFEYFDVMFQTINGYKVRFYAGKIPNA